MQNEEITANEIRLYNILLDEVTDANEIIARKTSPEYAEALQAAAAKAAEDFQG